MQKHWWKNTNKIYRQRDNQCNKGQLKYLTYLPKYPLSLESLTELISQLTKQTAYGEG